MKSEGGLIGDCGEIQYLVDGLKYLACSQLRYAGSSPVPVHISFAEN